MAHPRYTVEPNGSRGFYVSDNEVRCLASGPYASRAQAEAECERLTYNANAWAHGQRLYGKGFPRPVCVAAAAGWNEARAYYLDWCERNAAA